MQITNFWTRLIAFYWDQHCFTISHLVISWTRKMGDWASYFSDKILLTKIIYHSLIQFKILHRLYYSKSKLNKIVPNVSPICDKCLLQEATITLSFASKGQVYLHFPFFFFFLLSYFLFDHTTLVVDVLFEISFHLFSLSLSLFFHFQVIRLKMKLYNNCIILDAERFIFVQLLIKF